MSLEHLRLFRLAAAAAFVCGGVWAESAMAGEPQDGEPVSTSSQSTLTIEKCQIRVIDRALLAAERDGVVAAINVKEGDVVDSRDVVVQLQDEAARARYEVEKMRASNDVNVRYSQVLADTTKAEYDAGLELDRKNAISTFDLRRRKLEFERGLLSIEQAEFDLELAKVSVVRAEAELKGYHIAAPFGGTVIRVLKQTGESVINGEPVVEIVSTDRVYVEGYGTLNDLWNVCQGLRVQVYLQLPGESEYGDPTEAFEGQLILVDPVVQPVTGKVRVLAEVDNSENILRDGLKARMVIDRTAPVDVATP